MKIPESEQKLICPYCGIYFRTVVRAGGAFATYDCPACEKEMALVPKLKACAMEGGE